MTEQTELKGKPGEGDRIQPVAEAALGLYHTVSQMVKEAGLSEQAVVDWFDLDREGWDPNDYRTG